jgi:glucan 1,3-beta-glucosidase
VDTLAFIAKNIGGMVDIVELLNEPAAFSSTAFQSTLRQFWSDGYAAVRPSTNSNIMIGDGFIGVDVC